jgi:hypothetical protein
MFLKCRTVGWDEVIVTERSSTEDAYHTVLTRKFRPSACDDPVLGKAYIEGTVNLLLSFM